jgi:hypothetical protein
MRPLGNGGDWPSLAAFHPLRNMLRMPGLGQPAGDFARKAERRARFALGYLVLFGLVLILILVAMMW